MTQYLTAAESAKLMRKALKEAFPKVKFSVRSDRTSIDVSWQDGPNPAQVESVTNRFQGSYFDGFIDYKGSIKHMLDGVQINLGSDFVFTRRSYSDSFVQRAIDFVYSRLQANFERDGIEKPTVDAYRQGNLYMVQLSGLHHNGMQSVQHEIYQFLAKHSDRLKVENSPTANRLIVIGDDGYSRACGSGFSAVPTELADGSPVQVLADAAIAKARMH